jgi:flagellar protein FlbD
MIRLTRLNHVGIVLNSDLIEHIDVTPDTVITLTTGQILRVRETAEEVVERIVEFRRRILAGPEEPAALPSYPRNWTDDPWLTRSQQVLQRRPQQFPKRRRVRGRISRPSAGLRWRWPAFSAVCFWKRAAYRMWRR